MRPPEVSIGKFDILATYAYAKALLEGQDDDRAKQRGMVTAIMGGQGAARRRDTPRAGFRGRQADRREEEKTTIKAESSDHQVADKMGEFFDRTFLPAMTDLVRAGFSYPEVKRIVAIQSTWGAKISGGQFRERWQAARDRHGASQTPAIDGMPPTVYF